MKRDWRWPIGITALLAVFVTANLLVMRMASADPSFAIEPDYYAKAVAFDSTLEIERESAALGWVASAELASDSVVVTLVDHAGGPVRGATVAVSARFNARASDVKTASLAESAPGRYVAAMRVAYRGEWEVRVDAHRGAQRFASSVRTSVSSVSK